MNQRSADLLRFRPEIPNARLSPDMTPDEYFQNSCLRPRYQISEPATIGCIQQLYQQTQRCIL